MAIWLVEYVPYLKSGDDGANHEIPCFRIYPEDDPERWIAETNSDLPLEVQEEAALLVADALTKILGV